jgi:CRP/FNR family transcriptional regulator, cyclic AMP receptor protein
MVEIRRGKYSIGHTAAFRSGGTKASSSWPEQVYAPCMTTVPTGHAHGLDAERILSQPLFSSLSREEAEEFVAFCEARHVEKDSVVFSQGGLAVAFFVIESGEAEAILDGSSLRTMGPGDWFGEIAIVEQSHRTATVVATSPLTVIAMTAFEFRRLEAEHPDIAATITEKMQQRGHA